MSPKLRQTVKTQFSNNCPILCGNCCSRVELSKRLRRTLFSAPASEPTARFCRPRLYCGLFGPLPGAPVLNYRSRHTGLDTQTHPTPWTAAHRFTLCKRPSGMPASPRQGGISTLVRKTARAGFEFLGIQLHGPAGPAPGRMKMGASWQVWHSGSRSPANGEKDNDE